MGGSLGDRSDGEQVRFIEIPCDLMGPYGIIDQHEEAGVTNHASAQQWIEERLAETHYTRPRPPQELLRAIVQSFGDGLSIGTGTGPPIGIQKGPRSLRFV
jgi:hypothetical protein